MSNSVLDRGFAWGAYVLLSKDISPRACDLQDHSCSQTATTRGKRHGLATSGIIYVNTGGVQSVECSSDAVSLSLWSQIASFFACGAPNEDMASVSRVN